MSLTPERIVELANQTGYDPAVILQNALAKGMIDLPIDEDLLGAILRLNDRELQQQLIERFLPTDVTRGQAVISLYRQRLLESLESEVNWFHIGNSPGKFIRVLHKLGPSLVFDKLRSLIDTPYKITAHSVYGAPSYRRTVVLRNDSRYNAIMLYLYPLAHPNNDIQNYADFYRDNINKSAMEYYYDALLRYYEDDVTYGEIWLRKFIDLLIHTEEGMQLLNNTLHDRHAPYVFIPVLLKGFYSYYPEETGILFDLLTPLFLQNLPEAFSLTNILGDLNLRELISRAVRRACKVFLSDNEDK